VRQQEINRQRADRPRLAEIVSGIAVVVTPIFQVLGIRENPDVIRFSVYANLMDELNAF
jgi:hypothetical protein